MTLMNVSDSRPFSETLHSSQIWSASKSHHRDNRPHRRIEPGCINRVKDGGLALASSTVAELRPNKSHVDQAG